MGKFTEWYEKNKHLNIPPLPIFLSYEVMLQKGVFEKFIGQRFEIHFDGSYTLYHKYIWEYAVQEDRLLRWNSFEELLIWCFNN